MIQLNNKKALEKNGGQGTQQQEPKYRYHYKLQHKFHNSQDIS